MKKKLVLGLIVFGASAFAASNTFKVDIFQNSVVEGKALKAGQYKLSLENGNAVIRQGDQSITVPAHEESQPQKAGTTQLLYIGNTDLHAINVGGTHTTIVFQPSASTHAGM